MSRANHSRTLLLSLLTVVALACGSHDDRGVVQQTLTRNVDIDGDGVDDLVVLELHGESWKDPFRWSITASVNNTVSLSHDSDDSRIDKFFGESGYVNFTCGEYLTCKKQYYLHDILDGLVKTVISPEAYDPNNPASLHFVARKELIETYGLSDEDASEAVDWMAANLKARRLPVIYVPSSPVHSHLPQVYVPQVGKLVTVYQW